MSRPEKLALLSLLFDTREEAEAKAKELGPEWHVMRGQRWCNRGKFQLAVDA